MSVVNNRNELIHVHSTVRSVGEGISFPHAERNLNSLQLDSESRGRQYIEASIGDSIGEVAVRLHATASNFGFIVDSEDGLEDTVTRRTRIVPKGFPRSRSFGGILNPSRTVQAEFSLREDETNIKASVVVFPTPGL